MSAVTTQAPTMSVGEKTLKAVIHQNKGDGTPPHVHFNDSQLAHVVVEILDEVANNTKVLKLFERAVEGQTPIGSLNDAGIYSLGEHPVHRKSTATLNHAYYAKLNGDNRTHVLNLTIELSHAIKARDNMVRVLPKDARTRTHGKGFAIFCDLPPKFVYADQCMINIVFDTVEGVFRVSNYWGSKSTRETYTGFGPGGYDGLFTSLCNGEVFEINDPMIAKMNELHEDGFVLARVTPTIADENAHDEVCSIRLKMISHVTLAAEAEAV